MPNRLARETSPYLLQHADNPVDWYAWGPEALERARRENRPILLSIGYAACHWCHVMEHESFEDPDTAALMNERFVNIKVDREERPDLDAIYMEAVQAMSGHGGWPMTVFLTPEGAPFYAGTYFPKQDAHGMPSFGRVLHAVSDAYANRPGDVARGAQAVQSLYARSAEQTRSAGPLSRELLDRAFSALAAQYDGRHGGFDGAPKFPPTMALEFLLAYWARSGKAPALEMVTHTFRRMSRGGIYDQVGGGFARYAVDAIWLVPHFEKMLYDNALLVSLGVHVWQATGDAEARQVVEDTIEWLAREMTSPHGGFYSSLDADSEGHEGKFYVWSAAEIEDLLGSDAALAKACWGVTAAGNFEGKNILFRPDGVEDGARQPGVSAEQARETLRRARAVLYEARSKRVPPGRDEKILSAWNGLMLRAVAEAARAFGSEHYKDLAIRNGEFLFAMLVRDERVLRTYNRGEAKIAGFLEDYAALGLGALALYELTFDARWLRRAQSLAESTVRWFWDDDTGAFFDTASDAERLITRPRDATDNAVPSGTSLAVDLLTRVAELTHDVDARRRASYVVETLAAGAARYPTAFGQLLSCADMLVNGASELAIVGPAASPGVQDLVRAASSLYVPALVIAGDGGEPDEGRVALLQGLEMVGGRATAYVCRNYACELPVTEAEALRTQLGRTATATAAG